MENNQKKIQDCQSNEQFRVNNLPGIWRIGAAAICKDRPGYAIERLMHWDTDWVSNDEIVTIVAADCRNEQQEQAWAEIQCTEECMKEEQKWKPVPNMSQEEYDKMRESKELPDMSDYHMYTSVQETGLEIMVKAAEEGKMKIVVEGTPFPDSVPVFHDHVEGEPGRVEEYGASMYLQDESADSMIIGEDNICPVTKQLCDDECCPPGAVCNISGDGLHNTSEPVVNPIQQSIIQSYEQYINPPDAEIYQSLVDKLRPLQEYENMKMCIRLKYQEDPYKEIDWEKSCIAIMKEKMEIEQKILKWYSTHRDEEFRVLFDISVNGQGKIE